MGKRCTRDTITEEVLMGVGCCSSSFFIFLIVQDVVTKLNNDNTNQKFARARVSLCNLVQILENTDTQN